MSGPAAGEPGAGDPRADLTSRAPGTAASAPGRGAARAPSAGAGSESVSGAGKGGTAPRRLPRRLLAALAAAVALVLVVVGVVLVAGRGNGTHRLARPLEVRRLVATFSCNGVGGSLPPSRVRLEPGEEIVQVPHAGCALVGPALASVDRLTKVSESGKDATCVVKAGSTKAVGAVLDAASSAGDGQVRALVAGGWLLDVRAVIDYPGRPAQPLALAFAGGSQPACDAVAAALR